MQASDTETRHDLTKTELEFFKKVSNLFKLYGLARFNSFGLPLTYVLVSLLFISKQFISGVVFYVSASCLFIQMVDLIFAVFWRRGIRLQGFIEKVHLSAFRAINVRELSQRVTPLPEEKTTPDMALEHEEECLLRIITGSKYVHTWAEDCWVWTSVFALMILVMFERVLGPVALAIGFTVCGINLLLIEKTREKAQQFSLEDLRGDYIQFKINHPVD